MAVSDLYLLVKSLDKPERDRVQANAKRVKKGGNTVYLDLFDDLWKATSYTTDKAFLESHKKATYSKSFAQMKGYLFDFILDALRSQRTRAGAEKPKDFQIRELIEESHLLRSKLLLGHSLHRLEKARAEAEACQFYELLLETLKLLRTHLNEQAAKDKARELQSTLARIREVGHLIHLNCQLLVFRDELFGYVRRSANPDAELQAMLSENLRQVQALDALSSSSIEAKTNHHLILALYAWIQGDRKQSWEHHRAVYLLWKDAGDFAKERKVQHLKLLNNFLTTSIAAGKSEDFIDALDFLEKSANPTPEAKAESTQNTAYIRLQYFLSRTEWDNALKIEEEFNEKPSWAIYKTNSPRLQMFYLSFARLHFVLGNFKDARKYLGWFDAERNQGLNDDKWAEAIVLKVLILLSEEAPKKAGSAKPIETDIVNQIRSARRSLKGLHNPAAYLDEILKGINRLSNKDLFGQQDGWKKLLQTIRSLVGRSEYDSASQLFLAWIQSKTEAKSLSTLLQEAFPIYTVSSERPAD